MLARTKFTEIGTSRREDLIERGWYEGVHLANGVWTNLRSRMESSNMADAVPSIDGSTEEIVASLAEPFTEGNKRLGLVIGNVQSGKTANYSAVIAKALDSGYKFILVLSGIHNNLRKQTQLRLDHDLGVTEDSTKWYRLTNENGDFAPYQGNAGAIVNSGRVLAVVKKNSSRLQNVLDFLRDLDPDMKRQTPFLIIDDESDQATPDSSSKIGDEPTAINRLMRQIWDEVGNGTYVGYTATPFANIFMDPNSGEKSDLPDLYPKDFIHVMPTPTNYFGAERIFGLGEPTGGADDINTPDVVRAVPKAEVGLLVPTGKNVAKAQPPVTASLADAIRWFVVATAVRRVRGQHSKHSTMLVHTTQRVDPHFALRDAINDYLEPLKERAREGDVDSFHDIFTQEIDRAADLHHGADKAPTWPRVRDEIPNVLRALRTAVDNGKADDTERLVYPDSPQTVIVVGGGTLSRGLTLEGLFVSFFTRVSTNAYDTLLQMGRWFGYREGYADLQRIWLSPGLEDDYRFLAGVEADVREEIALMIATNKKPKDIGVRVLLHPGRLQVTSSSKMKHVSVAEADFEGFQLQTTRFVPAEAVFSGNFVTTTHFLDEIASCRDPQNARLHRDVEFGRVKAFLDQFGVHPSFEDSLKDLVAWTNEFLPEKKWNVVVSSGNEAETLTVGDERVRAVRRSAIVESDASKGINIRALMRGGDMVADLKLQGLVPERAEGKKALDNIEQKKLRRSRSGGEGRGLLLLYPISRRSSAGAGEVRQSMDVALRGYDERLVDEGLPPIMGIAVIAPFDADNKLERKGTRVSVTPRFAIEADEAEIANVVDTEGDFKGGSV
ncbi:hypothetical protein GCM10010922_28100 [Microbacterium sorbitolivorans]|uniref:Putative endonuclease Z1 domain-containing protein n=1 Tax=Microbacterium sorbitolivorans TaxID=1867410 RepID=A0A367XSY8_9MICO|nr:Z1 domain-containing protein [Microbacterium sorbitolivorans]RCK56745.1 hypothetical protein DTO57_14170 [Microbacterium sorbitolivorans]GGF50579.1 hypothetical protein GCM10010922_28100 [Microbacterium sorbitolivorans]